MRDPESLSQVLYLRKAVSCLKYVVMSRHYLQRTSKMSRVRFENLKTDWGKRVRIAKDVLAQIEAKKILPVQGEYVGINEKFEVLQGEKESKYGWQNNLSLQDLLRFEPLKNQPPCQACALGSMLCGLTVNNGDFELTGNYRKYLTDALGKYFSQEQLDCIEGCFEGSDVPGTGGHSEGWSWIEHPVVKIYSKYFRTFHNSTKRLQAIMNNIIRNRGEFKPEQDLTSKRKK